MSGKDDTEMMFSTPTFFYIPSKNFATTVLLPQTYLNTTYYWTYVRLTMPLVKYTE